MELNFDYCKEYRTKLGQMMFVCMTKLEWMLSKHIVVYYILNYTWGLLTSLIGLLISLVLIIIGYKPVKYHGCWYFKIGKNYGGFSIGTTCVVCDTYSELLCHEYGHTYQNAILGPLWIFLVGIPSVIRYWIRSYKKDNSLYDSIWFEANASYIGQMIVRNKEK